MSDEKYFGMLVAVMADTPASQLLDGFKAGVSFANKPCRQCDIRREELSTVHIAAHLVLRNEREHRDRVNELKQVTKEAYIYWSKEYGINGESILLEVPGFNISKCLLQDPMHVLL
jgi:hypothetical protein